jgi:acyl-CoA synthetase (AMP-forming)/AMP-acid ligase II
MPGVEVRIDASGEIQCRGPTRALGYVGGRFGPLADPEGWYATGDLGRIDDDGLLRITGRRIDRIVSGGVTVDAVEVEEALRSHPAVVDVCVVGVPDAEWGERVAAFVVPVEGEFDVEEATEHLRDALMAAKVPRLWRLTAELPRNANGKVDRGAVRSLLSEA